MGLLTHPRVEPVVATLLRARTLREPVRFAARELTGRTGPARYRVRGTDVVLLVEHGTPDVLLIDELFYQHLYVPPAPIAAALARHGDALRVLDLGGNIGLFGVHLAATTPFASLLSVEPDARNAERLAATIAANGLGDRWRLERAAAATHAGEVHFAGGDFATSHVTDAAGDGTVVVPALDALDLLAGVDYAKVDIEGGEWALLADPRFGAVAPEVLVLEYHPEGAPEADTHGAVRRLLEAAGYAVTPIFEAPTGVGMAWALRV